MRGVIGSFAGLQNENSLRFLCVLCVSAVHQGFANTYRRDAEYAEEAQRVSKKNRDPLTHFLIGFL